MDLTNDLSSEPMEIDLSSQSVHAMDISCGSDDDSLSMKVMKPSSPRSNIQTSKSDQSQLDKTVEEPPTIKYCHINLKRHSRGYVKKYFKIIFAVIVAFVSITTYYLINLKCCDDLNFKKLNETLLKNLYGQSNAANLLSQTLEIKASSKILFFSGGTGVGKTLTSSLLLDFIGPCSNVYHYTTATFENTFSPEIMYGITLCKSSIVVVDDVTVNNNYIKKQISNLISKTNNLGKEITVILIFNCNENRKDYSLRCDKLFNNKILDDFSDVEALKVIIPFETLSVKSLKQCIIQELGNRKLDELQFDSLLKHFDVSADGCKGVHSKIKYLNIL